ncbi:hypothetical protein FE784_18495 [Paenibacillus hemerocallicola]|uniref:Uncharacterized protein n=1 Tax=Paenibacillus hemerocallicola TaxID=1172614 RepID=A0A5C4T7K8_9BACL|nr:hypothetical protein [Paenibacillus hemerocallicola]TNJ64835.1 hypothetical protein FE784_18495 [Paenibacillus hemerocallicola]
MHEPTRGAGNGTIGSKISGTLSGLLPRKIKYRFFFSFVIVIHIPFFLFQLYYFNRTERLIVERAVNHYEKRFQLQDEHRFPAMDRIGTQPRIYRCPDGGIGGEAAEGTGFIEINR